MNNLSIKVAEQTLKLLAINEWENISVNKVFKKLNINKKKTFIKINNKIDLNKNINTYFDFRISKNLKSIELSTSRDMVFEVMMLRFDFLNEYRLSVKKLFNNFKKYPKTFICLLPSFIESTFFMAESANINTKGFTGNMKIKILLIIYFSSFLTWMKDESSSLDKTMMKLDLYLERTKNIMEI